jgi:chemotaxis protein MotA
MFFIIGLIIVFGCVFGSYAVHGDMGILWQPLEFIIIFGAAIGAFLIANTKPIISGTMKSMGLLLKGPRYTKASYLELLGMLYAVFKLAKTKGDLALESHVEKPEESAVFQQFPGFMNNHHAVEFFCDYLRMLTLGTSNPHEVEGIMEVDLEIHHNEHHAISGALQTMSDGLPALGIVAAVLGVIVTMGSITEPPEVLGKLIGAALVGTFSGVLAAYGMVAPMAKFLENTFDADARYLACIKAAIIAHMQGYAPQVSVEFARKTLASDSRPTFAEVDEMIQNQGASA